MNKNKFNEIVGEVFKEKIKQFKPLVRCKRCGKILLDYKSRKIGYGPVCLKKMKEENTIKMMRPLFDTKLEK